MAQVNLTTEQSARLQAEIQSELERREWAEPDDNVMAEYITVLLANGSSRERVNTEMDDLVGSDFDSFFLDWLFDKAGEIASAAPAPAPAVPAPIASPVSAAGASASPSTSRPASSAPGGNRLLNTALAPLSGPGAGEKRKADQSEGSGSGQNKKRLSDIALGNGNGNGVPAGPRAMGEGRGLADRIGGPGIKAGYHPGQPAGMGSRGRGVPIRGMAGGRGAGHVGGFRPNFQAQPQLQQQQQPQQQQNMGQPGFGFMPPQQQEMMAQMMMMQANMAQMNQMMNMMTEERQRLEQRQHQAPQHASTPAGRPARPPAPAKLPHGTKLGGHSVSAIPPKASTPGPIPDKPTSTALCRYSVGCSNSRCPFSHPSPVADEKTGMVLSEEPCEEGKLCKDVECVKSHVSPAATLGETAGPSRLLCKYLNCTNPSCPFRHEDSEGNPIPPPALTAAKAAKDTKHVPAASSDVDDGEFEVVMTHKGLMDGALEDSVKKEVVCRYGERCTRADCKFSHPASRPTPKPVNFGSKKSFPARSANTSKSFTAPSTTSPANGAGIGGGMHMSKKFGAAAAAPAEGGERGLNPAAGEFKPAAPVAAGASAQEKDLDVTI